MKRAFLTFVFSMISIAVFSQSTQYLGTPKSTISIRGRLSVDSLFMLPATDTAIVTTPIMEGAMIYQASNATVYFFNGFYWVKFSGDFSTLVKKADSGAAYLTPYAITSYALKDSVYLRHYIDSAFTNKQDVGTVILNQSESKQDAVSRYRKNIVDTLTNNKNSKYSFDLSSTGTSFLFDGSILQLGTKAGQNLYIGLNAGLFPGPNSGNTFVGTDAGWSNYGNSNTAFGFFSGYDVTGSGNTSVGSYSGFSSDSSYNTFLGYNSGFGSSFNQSTIIGSYAQSNSILAQDSIDKSEFTFDTLAGLLEISGQQAKGLIALSGLNTGGIIGFYCNYSTPYPKTKDSVSVNQISGRIIVSNDSTLTIKGQLPIANFGSGKALVVISKLLNNVTALGYKASADSNNQVVLGNASTTQVKFGSGNIRINTSIQPSNNQTLVYDASANEFKPGSTGGGSDSFWGQTGDDISNSNPGEVRIEGDLKLTKDIQTSPDSLYLYNGIFGIKIYPSESNYVSGNLGNYIQGGTNNYILSGGQNDGSANPFVNRMINSTDLRFILGGYDNEIDSARASIIASMHGRIFTGASHSILMGGSYDTTAYGNYTGQYAAQGSYLHGNNAIQIGTSVSKILDTSNNSGQYNAVQSIIDSSKYAIQVGTNLSNISGGLSNAQISTISGDTKASNYTAMIAGNGNKIKNGSYTFIGGGNNIQVQGTSVSSAGGIGGSSIFFSPTTVNDYSFFGAGYRDTIGATSSTRFGAIFGRENKINGDYSFAHGNVSTTNGTYTVAWGNNMHALASGAWAIGDGQSTYISNSLANSFLARFSNGYKFTGGGLTATQFKLSDLNTPPASATDTGTKGEIRITSDYIYVCIATNTWARAALSTW